MKKLTYCLLATVALAASGIAGTEVAVSGKEYKTPAPEPCFKDVEFQLDVFGSYNNPVKRSDYSDDFGGGIGVNYFFTRFLGVGVSGNVYDGGVHGVWNVDASVIARYPLELGTICIAPYALAGGGVQTDGLTAGSWHAGGGLEWRATPSFGIFGEGRYTWSENNDAAAARVGIRVIF